MDTDIHVGSEEVNTSILKLRARMNTGNRMTSQDIWQK